MNERIPSLDVTRAVAMFGVVALNYHGYLNPRQWTQPLDQSLWESIFSPLTGILTTRFAATFVFVAGIGIALFFRSTQGDPHATARRRLVLFRRGAILFGLGLVLEWIWPGTILFYYGAYFILATIVVTWRTTALVWLMAVITVMSAAISGWRFDRGRLGESTSWLTPELDSPRNLLIRVFIDHTHPVLPWFAFLIAGIILGRHIGHLAALRGRLIAIAAVALGLSHLARDAWWPNALIDRNDVIMRVLVSTDPYDRSVLYVVSALATAVFAFVLISWLVDSRRDSPIVEYLARIGQLSLSIYVLHVLFFNLVVDWLGVGREGGLSVALALAIVFYAFALALAGWWSRLFGMGPIERVYRLIGG